MKSLNKIDEKLFSKWMYFNCPKQFSWIVYNNLSQIIASASYQDYINLDDESELNLSTENLLYVHSVYMTNEKLVALLEATDGIYLIDNIKKSGSEENPSGVVSKIFRFQNFTQFLSRSHISVRNLLEIKKSSLRKLTQSQTNQQVIPSDYFQTSDQSSLLDKECSSITPTSISGHLDLSFNFTVDSEILFQWEPKLKRPTELSMNTCYQLRDFKWLNAEWVKSITKLNLINMTQITNENIEFIVAKMINLKELYVHQCPQINIRVLLGALKEPRLELLMLNDVNLTSQPNQYSGLITEDEWEMFRNRSLKRLFINSSSISLDIVDYLRTSCLALNDLILDHKKYQLVKENLIHQENPDLSNKLIIASTNGVKMEVPRDFNLKNLLKHSYSKPFSSSMERVMARLAESEKNESHIVTCEAN